MELIEKDILSSCSTRIKVLNDILFYSREKVYEKCTNESVYEMYDICDLVSEELERISVKLRELSQ
ncbi:MAG: hypothetical protein E7509_04955 [Ruminococcus sp.]|nr:hypothetical protein [Ruminococcus sp.]